MDFAINNVGRRRIRFSHFIKPKSGGGGMTPPAPPMEPALRTMMRAISPCHMTRRMLMTKSSSSKAVDKGVLGGLKRPLIFR